MGKSMSFMDLLNFKHTGEVVFQRGQETIFMFWEKCWHPEKNFVCTQDKIKQPGGFVVVVAVKLKIVIKQLLLVS